MSDRSVRRDGSQLDSPLTEHSAPGSYFVITASRTIYQVEVLAGDSSSITRYPRVNSLLLGGEPLTGVRSFFFDPTSGLGQIQWWKPNVADRDRPDRHYAGTVRTTSAVLLMLRVHHTTMGRPYGTRPTARIPVYCSRVRVLRLLLSMRMRTSSNSCDLQRRLLRRPVN